MGFQSVGFAIWLSLGVFGLIVFQIFLSHTRRVLRQSRQEFSMPVVTLVPTAVAEMKTPVAEVEKSVIAA